MLVFFWIALMSCFNLLGTSFIHFSVLLEKDFIFKFTCILPLVLLLSVLVFYAELQNSAVISFKVETLNS